MDAWKIWKVLFSVFNAHISIFILLQELLSEWPLTLIILPAILPDTAYEVVQTE